MSAPAIAMTITIAASLVPIFTKILKEKLGSEEAPASLAVEYDHFDQPKRWVFPDWLKGGLIVAILIGLSFLGMGWAQLSNSGGSLVDFSSVFRGLTHNEFFYQALFLIAIIIVVFFARHEIGNLTRQLDSSSRLLFGFACVVAYFGGTAVIHYWHQISLSADRFYLALGLFFTMVAGMFVQVIAANFKGDSASLLAVTPSQLLYPVLFAPIVFYSIWALASSSSAGLFSFYAAFLNGYFWQSVVNSAQKTQGQTAPSPTPVTVS